MTDSKQKNFMKNTRRKNPLTKDLNLPRVKQPKVRPVKLRGVSLPKMPRVFGRKNG